MNYPKESWWQSLSLGLHLGKLSLWGHKYFLCLYAACLGLGLSGFYSFQLISDALIQHMNRESKKLLGADLALRVERMFSAEELAQLKALLPPGTQFAEEQNLTSMVRAKDQSRLFQIKALGPPFPFYGDFELQTKRPYEAAFKADLDNHQGLWADPEITAQLGIQLGAELAIGNATLTLRDVVHYDPTQGAGGFKFAPIVYLSTEALAKSGLIQIGSRVQHKLLAKGPPGFDAIAFCRSIKGDKDLALGLRCISHEDASRDLNRALRYFNDYMALLSLLAVLLASLGAAYLYRSFLYQNEAETRSMRYLGLSQRALIGTYASQLLLLALCSSVVAIGLGILGLPLLRGIFKAFIPQGMVFEIQPLKVLGIVLIALGAQVICLIPLARSRWLKAFLGLGSLAYVFGLSFYASKSWLISFGFSAFILLALSLLGLFMSVALLWGEKLKWQGLVPDLIWAGLCRQRGPAILSILALSVGFGFLSLIPQLRLSISRELKDPGGIKRPELFLFDVQDEQYEPLKALLESLKVPVNVESPLIRARLSHVKGQDLGTVNLRQGPQLRSQEDELKTLSENRAYNLSYRAQLSSAETLIKGQEFSGRYDPNAGVMAEISLEKEFSKRLNLDLGDSLKFDVQGVEIEGVVRSIRKVRWASFQPNFFVLFQPGVLEDAPKTYLIALNLPATGVGKFALQQRIVEAFPNVAIVDVAEALQRVEGLIAELGQAVDLLAWLTLMTALMVLFALTIDQSQRLKDDLILLKILGLSRPALRAILLGQLLLLASFSLGFAGLLCASSLSLLEYAGLIISGQLEFGPFIQSATLSLVATLLVGLFALWPMLRLKPKTLGFQS